VRLRQAATAIAEGRCSLAARASVVGQALPGQGALAPACQQGVALRRVSLRQRSAVKACAVPSSGSLSGRRLGPPLGSSAASSLFKGVSSFERCLPACWSAPRGRLVWLRRSWSLELDAGSVGQGPRARPQFALRAAGAAVLCKKRAAAGSSWQPQLVSHAPAGHQASRQSSSSVEQRSARVVGACARS